MLLRKNTVSFRPSHKSAAPASAASNGADLLRDLEMALRLRAQGKFEEASRVCTRVLKAWPNNFDALHLNGLLLHLQGRNKEALPFLSAALTERPFEPAVLSNLGLVHSLLGRTAEALAFYEKALFIVPDYAEAHSNRANALVELERPAEALESCARALALKPDHVAALYNRGNALMALGRKAEALETYDRAIALRPGFVDALCNRANALVDLNRPAEALASCDQALALKPDHAEAHMNRGNALMELKRAAAALASYDVAISLSPNIAEAFLNRGNAMRDLGRTTEALADYERAVVLKSALADAHANKGIVLTELGRFGEARDAIERAIKLQPRRVRFYHNLAESRKMTANDPHIAAMEELARGGNTLSAEERIELGFALGKALADIGEHERSFEYLLSGNAVKRAVTPYNEAATLGLLSRTERVFSRETIERHAGSGETSHVPVFIVGMPRSGTTLVEQILASHPAVYGAGEIDDFEQAIGEMHGEVGTLSRSPEAAAHLSPSVLRELGQRYIARIRRAAPWAERIVNKMPENFRVAGLIHLALPNARILHTRRDPADTCVSCFSHLFWGNNLPYAYSLEELGRYYRAYEALMAHWQSVLPSGTILDVSYEDLVADVEGGARRIIAHCGLDWSPRCLEFYRTKRTVRTASVTQVRQPIYRSSVGRSRVHAERLRPLYDSLGLAVPILEAPAPAP